MTLQELFSDESKWTQGVSARTAYGDAVSPRDKDATCWCLVGGMEKCYSHLGQGAFLEVKYKLYGATLDYQLVEWNDDINRTFADVQRAVREANV